MTRDIINVQYPTLDHTESVANICIEKTDVVPAQGSCSLAGERDRQ